MKKTLPNETLYMNNFITLSYKEDAFEHTPRQRRPQTPKHMQYSFVQHDSTATVDTACLKLSA